MNRSPFGRRIAARIFQPRGTETGEVFLNQRRVFILPTRAGLMLSAMLVALLLGSINYSLSLGFALTFLVVAIAWVGMLSTFRNLAHLYLRPLRVEPVFAGDAADYRLVVRNAAAIDRYAIVLSVDGLARAVPCDPPAGVEQDVTIPVVTERRGWQAMPRVTLATRFPLGLWRAWSYWTPALSVMVYPRPAESAVAPAFAQGHDRDQRAERVRGSEDFAGLRAYVTGDPVRQIAWRAMARNPEGRVMTKLFDGDASGEVLFTLEEALSLTAHFEAALSLMTRWVLDAEGDAVQYGLVLREMRIVPGRGPAHRDRCLQALALAAP
ncbi:MAG: DUF58 domain-containing protein [Burkholderiaceae bacterium]